MPVSRLQSDCVLRVLTEKRIEIGRNTLEYTIVYCDGYYSIFYCTILKYSTIDLDALNSELREL